MTVVTSRAASAGRRVLRAVLGDLLNKSDGAGAQQRYWAHRVTDLQQQHYWAHRATALQPYPGAPYTGEWADARRALAKARAAVVPSLADNDTRLLVAYTSAVNEELLNHDRLTAPALYELSVRYERLKQLNVVGVTETDLERRVEADATVGDLWWKTMDQRPREPAHERNFTGICPTCSQTTHRT